MAENMEYSRLKNMIQKINLNSKIIFQELFYFTVCLWLALVILEIIWPNIVLAYFNLNLLLVVVIVLGIISFRHHSVVRQLNQSEDDSDISQINQLNNSLR